MNLIINGTHIFPHILPILALDIIMLTVTATIMSFILREGVGRKWEKYEVRKL